MTSSSDQSGQPDQVDQPDQPDSPEQEQYEQAQYDEAAADQPMTNDELPSREAQDPDGPRTEIVERDHTTEQGIIAHGERGERTEHTNRNSERGLEAAEEIAHFIGHTIGHGNDHHDDHATGHDQVDDSATSAFGQVDSNTLGSTSEPSEVDEQAKGVEATTPGAVTTGQHAQRGDPVTTGHPSVAFTLADITSGSPVARTGEQTERGDEAEAPEVNESPYTTMPARATETAAFTVEVRPDPPASQVNADIATGRPAHDD